MRLTTVVRMMALQQSYKRPITTSFLKIQPRSVSTTRSVSTMRNLNAVQMAEPDFYDYGNYIDYKELAIRRANALKNLYAPKTFTPCHYCHGTGYIECTFCNDGCWRCEHTTMLKCPFCGGDGEGRPIYQTVPNK